MSSSTEILQQRADLAKRIYRYDASIDQPSRVSDALTFVRLASLLRSADDGDAEAMLQLNAEMESKDLHLQSVAHTRRLALTGIEWEIEPASRTDEGVDEKAATAAADFVRATLRNMIVYRQGRPVRPFDHALDVMSGAIGPNLAVLELVWNGPQLADIVPIPHTRLTFDLTASQTVRIVTKDQKDGAEPPRNKCLIHSPNDVDEYPFTNTIAKAQAVVYLMKSLAMADWQTFIELFGQPMRIGKWHAGASDDDRKVLKTALQSMGTSFWGMMPEGMAIEIIETSNRQAEPYSAIIELLERKQTIGYLGQTLTTDTTGATGTYAAASVHDNVRRDILKEDIKAEARTIEEQLFVPLVAFRWPGDDMPVPKFRRHVRDPVDRALNAQVISAAVNQLGLPVEQAAAYELLELPEPQRDEAGKTINKLIEPLVVAPPAGGMGPMGGGR